MRPVRASLFLCTLVVAPGLAAAQALVVDATNSPYAVVADTTFGTVTVAAGGTLVVDAGLTVTGDMTVLNGGTVSHGVAVSASRLDVAGTLDVQPGGAIDASALGLAAGQTFDPVTQSVVAGAGRYGGGSHGGRGGGGPATYGDPRDPAYLGGGGGSGDCGNVGGRGGGRVRIAAGTLRVDGVLRANGAGATGGCTQGGGGAGGSLRIDAGTLAGSGAITATGGASNAGGGGGGRIAIFTSGRTFTGSVAASGGSGGTAGALGSVWLLDAATDLTVAQGEARIGTGDAFRSVTIAGGGVLTLAGPAQVTQAVALPLGATVQVVDGTALQALSLPARFAGKVIVAVPFAWPQPITLDGELVVNAALDVAGDLTVESGGRVTHDPAVAGAAISTAGTLWVKLGGVVDLDAKGLGPGEGFDPLTLQVTANVGRYAGGSHGGSGGGASNPTYGDARDPLFLGSGGGSGDCGNVGARGGGHLAIAAGTLRVDGIVRAGGGAAGGGCTQGGGGAGGALRIDATTIAGAGVISANGGGSNAGGGGGGRIAAYYDTFTFGGTLAVTGGAGGTAGAPGTVHLESAQRALTVSTGVTSIGAGDSYDSVTLLPGAILRLTGAAQVTQPISIPAGTTVILEDAAATQALSLPARFAGTLVVNVGFAWAQPLDLDGTLVVNAPLSVTGDVTVESGGVVTHDPGVEVAQLDATGTIWIRPGGFVDLNGKGWAPGVGLDLSTLQPAANVGRYAGGSHGGAGGGSSNPLYGDPRAPEYPGAGGGSGDCGNVGARGGGRLALSATTLRVDGTLRADGAPAGGGCTQGGGGAGGSLRVVASTFTGSGVVSAAGGGSNAGGGGGGRIAITYDTDTFAGVLSAAGGGGGTPGAAGTVYRLGSARQLVVAGGLTRIDGADSYDSIVLQAAGVLDVRGAAQVTQPIVVASGSTVILSAPDALASLAIDPAVAGTLQVDSDLAFPTDLQLAGRLVVNRHFTVPNLTTTLGAVIAHGRGVTTMHLEVSGRLALAQGSSIDGTGLGLAPGPWAGYGSRGATIDVVTLVLGPGSGRANGGSHFTAGGVARATEPVAAGYDDPAAPIYPGGGGGDGDCGNAGGFGGGVVRVTAGILAHDGTITANGGTPGGGCTQGGGGGGGAIVLVAGDWTGGGVLDVRGGDSNAGGGAGGLVHVSWATKSFTGPVTVLGGTGSAAGSDGVFTEVTVSTPPRITTTPPAIAVVGQTLRYLPTAVGTPPFTWSLVAGPPGAAVDAASGELTWAPASAGLAQFTIGVSSPAGSDEQSFQVTAVGPPRITSTASTSGAVGQPYHYAAQDTATASGSAPLAWSVTLGPPGFAIDAASGLVSWVPDAEGSFDVCIQVSNPAGSDQQCFTVLVVAAGAAPAIVSTAATSGQVGFAYSYDADGRAEATGTAPIVWTAPVAPSGFTIAGATGLVAWTPAAAGPQAVCLEATNAYGSATQCFSVDVRATSNEPPRIVSVASTTGAVGLPYLYDGDGAAEATGTEPILWSTALAPAGFAIDPLSGAVTWTPAQAGAQNVCLQAANDFGDDLQCFTVDVGSPEPPRFTSTPERLATVGVAWAYDEDGRAEATGPGPIAYSLLEGPAGLTIDAATGEVSWTPDAAGNVDVALEAANAFGTAEQRFTVSVQPAGAGSRPVILQTANPVASVGTLYAYDEDGAADAAGDRPIAWSKLDGPPEFHVDAATGLVAWIPAAAGTIALGIAAENALGRDEYRFEVVVSGAAGRAPTAVLVLSPDRGAAPLAVHGDGTDSYAAPGSSIAFYRWDFGDGAALAVGPEADHAYEQPGSYVARLQVQDATGAVGTASAVVSVSGGGREPPKATIVASATEGRDTLEVGFSCDCSSGSAPIVSYRWDFADGSLSDAPSVTHLFGPGGYQVRLTVTDENGLAATDRLFVGVSEGENRPPLLVAQGDPLTGAAPLEVSFGARYGDVDGEVASVAWAFGDGGTSTDGAPAYRYEAPGVYLATVVVTDDGGLSSSGSVEVNVVGTGGELAPQIVSIPSGTASYGVAYRYDEDGRPAARGDRPLTWSLGKQVAGELVGVPAGMEVDAATGELTWTPDAGSLGTQHVVLVAQNAAGAAVQEWQLEVGGTPPPAAPPAEVAEDSGCGCGSPGSPRALAALLLLGLGLLAGRRAGPR